MDINPLSLLEVTMGGEQVQEDDDDDDCVILDPPIETHVIDDSLDDLPTNSEPEAGGSGGAGLHFLQQPDLLEDPLSLSGPSGVQNGNNIPYLWVTTNINNLGVTSKAEMDFRKMHYKDLHNVLEDRLHCTICQDHIGCDVRVHPNSIEHPVLKVLVCEKCSLYYKSLQFGLNESGKETRCRWCGQSPSEQSGSFAGPRLRQCQQCPFSFCEVCLHNNLPNLPNTPGWTCCVCNMKLLWPARSLLWALQTLKQRFLSSPAALKSFEDLSACAQRCRTHGPKKSVEKRKGNQIMKAIRSNIRLNVNGQNSGLGQKRNNQLNSRASTSNFGQPSNIVHSGGVSSDKMKTAWLTTKFEHYENDILTLANKIKKVRESCRAEETLPYINTKVETVTTLLSLNANLLKDCSLNLMNEWKEKRSRHAIENVSVSSQQYTVPNVAAQNNRIMQRQPFARPGPSAQRQQTEFLTPRRPPPKKKKPKPKPKPNQHKQLTPMQIANLKRKFSIKECFIKLQRLPNSEPIKAENENQ